ncbi:hypothetical protein [Nonlabens xiamenensis]|uniref:hypothetical protein n=1 Tax=Nonlabens xiamenensis TaxID=2341043 RepID=UPI000F604A01|nr:hypothetical protein [Nonlabens xiamenensis]
MAKKTKQELKDTFINGYKPTENDFEDLFDSFLHQDEDLSTKVPTVPSYLDFSGRFYLHPDKRWVSHLAYYGQATVNNYQSHGTGASPGILWNHIGFGYLPAGSVLKNLEFIGRVNVTEVEGVQIQLSCQGTNFNTSGYDSAAEAQNQVILPPTDLLPHSTEMYDMQRHEVLLNDFILDQDRILVFCCRGIGNITDTRYWSVQAKLHYQLP